MKKAQKHFVNTFHKSEALNSEGSTFSGFNHVSIGLSGDNYRVATLPKSYLIIIQNLKSIGHLYIYEKR